MRVVVLPFEPMASAFGSARPNENSIKTKTAYVFSVDALQIAKVRFLEDFAFRDPCKGLFHARIRSKRKLREFFGVGMFHVKHFDGGFPKLPERPGSTKTRSAFLFAEYPFEQGTSVPRAFPNRNGCRMLGGLTPTARVKLNASIAYVFHLSVGTSSVLRGRRRRFLRSP